MTYAESFSVYSSKRENPNLILPALMLSQLSPLLMVTVFYGYGMEGLLAGALTLLDYVHFT
jgi:hypothetical protein